MKSESVNTVVPQPQLQHQASDVAAVRPSGPPGPPGGKLRPGAKKKVRPHRVVDPLVKEFSAATNNGCFHCGEQGHARTPIPKAGLAGCPKFEAYKKSKGGTVPSTYEGALEKFIRQKRQPREPAH